MQLAGLLISAGGGNVGRRTDFISPLSAMATHPKSSAGGGRGGRRKALFAALAAELARRSPPVEQACEQLVETLGEMALRLAATTPLCPLQLDDMSPNCCPAISCPSIYGRRGCRPKTKFWLSTGIAKVGRIGSFAGC